MCSFLTLPRAGSKRRRRRRAVLPLLPSQPTTDRISVHARVPRSAPVGDEDIITSNTDITARHRFSLRPTFFEYGLNISTSENVQHDVAVAVVGKSLPASGRNC